MNNQKRHPLGAFALMALLATVLPCTGCGGDQADTQTGKVSIHATPAATVTVDGEARGTTPVDLDLTAGQHDLTLAVEGFETVSKKIDVKGGETTQVEHMMKLASLEDPALVDRVAKELGIETEPFEAPSVHRGAGDDVATLYWPRGRMRLNALKSFRIDVGETYGDDVPAGRIEFRKGKNVLFKIDEFDPVMPITIADIPEEVFGALKPGDTLTWGLYFDGRKHKKHSQSVKVKIVGKAEEKKVEKALAKLEDKKYFRAQDAITQKTMRAKRLAQSKLYTESLQAYITILMEHKGATSPFLGVVTNLRRVKLNDSQMFQVAAEYVGGKGGRSGVDKGRPAGMTGPNTGGLSPRARSIAMVTGPKGSRVRLGPGGAVDVDPNAHSGATNPSTDPVAPTNPGTNPGTDNGTGGERNDGTAPESNTGPQANNGGETNPGGPSEAVPSPSQRVEQGSNENQALRDALREAAGNGSLTPAQMQAAVAAADAADQALAALRDAAAAAEGGDPGAQRAYEEALRAYEQAAQAAKDAVPSDPANPPSAQPPATLEDAVRELAKTHPSDSAGKLLRVLQQARTGQEAAATAAAALEAARKAEADAIAAGQALQPTATDAEKQAAQDAVDAARTAREAAEAAASKAADEANALKGAVDEAKRRFEDVTRQAEELMRVK